jgi:hypothetical protein
MDGNSVAEAGTCPVAHGALPRPSRRSRANRDWWPNQLNLRVLRQHSALSNPMGLDFDYGREFQKLDYQGPQSRSAGAAAGQPELVAGGLGSLRAAVHPHGVAQRGNLPHRGRPRRRVLWHAALSRR